MPRKNPRPAARKALFKLREKLDAPVPVFYRPAPKLREPMRGDRGLLGAVALTMLAISNPFRK